MRFCDLRGPAHGCSIVPIDMQHARGSDFLLRDLVRYERQTIWPIPKHRSFTCGLIDQDIGRLVRAPNTNLYVVQVYTGFAETVHLDLPPFVVSTVPIYFERNPNFAHVIIALATCLPDSESPDETEPYLRMREVGDNDQGVRGIQTYANHVEKGNQESSLSRERGSRVEEAVDALANQMLIESRCNRSNKGEKHGDF